MLKAFAALSHPSRLDIFRLIMRRMPHVTRPSHILAAYRLKANTLSGYLTELLEAKLITVHREGRALNYRANMPQIASVLQFFWTGCCFGRPDLFTPLLNTEYISMTARSYHVLFICTGNSARSLFAEAILTQEGEGRFIAHSAGTAPAETPNAMAVDLLRRNGYSVDSLNPKPLSVFQGPEAPHLDFVFTVCDRAAAEPCDPWEGGPLTSHWPVADPVKAEGTEAARRLAFAKAFEELDRRIKLFAALAPESLDRASLQARLDDISIA